MLHVKLLAATAAAYALQRSVAGMVTPAASFETGLLDIAQKADLSDASMHQLGERVRKLAKDVGRGANDMAKGVDTLLGFGLDVDKTMEALPGIGRTATAYNAEVTDLAKAVFSSIDNLKVAAKDVPKILDSMAYSGKAGAFEIKDMAAEFPALTASAQALGMTGVDAVSKLTAALQIARKGAATGSEAATNTANLMQKIQSQDAVKKWKAFNVDIRGEVKKTQKAGGDIFVMLAENANKVLKGDLAKLGDLYQDEQVQKFLRPLIQNLEEYKRIRDGALSARGVVDQDFGRRMKTYEGQVRRLSGAFEDLRIASGRRFLGPLTAGMEQLSGILNSMDGRVSILDRLGNSIRGLVTGIMGPGSEGGMAQAFGKLGDLIFGKTETFSADVDAMGQSFEKFRQMGSALREFAAAIGGFVSGFQQLTGLDLSSLSVWALKLGAAAVGIGIFAKAIRGLTSAILALTGMKMLWSLGKKTGSLISALRPAGAAAPPAGSPAARPGGGNGSVPAVGGSRLGGVESVKTPRPMGAWSIQDLQKRVSAMLSEAPQASLMTRLGSVLKNGLFAGAVEYVGRTSMDAGLDQVDKRLGLDTSNRPDPGLVPTVQRLIGHFESWFGSGSKKGSDQSAGPLKTSDLQGLLQPKGTQDVRITNPPPVPSVPVSVSVVVNATTNASAADIGAAVGRQVGAQTKRALEGAFSDAAN
ncbi:phage tail tape measure protein [Bosea sp. MMO-172]|uniref:phage tail tape measure protein n=1 Tax=Bosea sp. MMO-172 TaxID=3127885 RepID=UPI0030195958